MELRTFYVEEKMRSIGLPAAAPSKKSRSYPLPKAACTKAHDESSDAEHEVHIFFTLFRISYRILCCIKIG